MNFLQEISEALSPEAWIWPNIGRHVRTFEVKEELPVDRFGWLTPWICAQHASSHPQVGSRSTVHGAMRRLWWSAPYWIATQKRQRFWNFLLDAFVSWLQVEPSGCFIVHLQAVPMFLFALARQTAFQEGRWMLLCDLDDLKLSKVVPWFWQFDMFWFHRLEIISAIQGYAGRLSTTWGMQMLTGFTGFLFCSFPCHDKDSLNCASIWSRISTWHRKA